MDKSLKGLTVFVGLFKLVLWLMLMFSADPRFFNLDLTQNLIILSGAQVVMIALAATIKNSTGLIVSEFSLLMQIAVLYFYPEYAVIAIAGDLAPLFLASEL